jgi:hypothetical protein
VRSHSVIYARQAALPDWLAVLQHELGSKDLDGRADLLMISAVLDELDTVVDGAIRGHGTLARPHWQSLLAELDHTRAANGPNVSRLLATPFASLDAALDPKTTPSAADAPRLGESIAQCRAALGDPAVRHGAWDDAVDGFRAGLDPETANARIRVLRDLAEQADGDWERISSTLSGALNNDTFALSGMGHDVSVEPGAHQDAAGLSLEARLDACRTFVGEETQKGHLIAWLAFDQASLPNFYLPLGPAEFWTAQVCPAWPREGRGRPGGPVPDFANDQHEMFLPPLDEPARVLVRLDLGKRSSAGAAEQARDLARTVVQMAVTASNWRLLDGCAFVREESWWGSTIHPEVEHFDNPVHEPTGRYLADLDPNIVEGLVSRLPDVEEIAADVKWAESVRQLPDKAQRAALAIRLLERRLPDAPESHEGWGKRDSWMARARWWLREDYANGLLFRDLRDAALEGVYGLPDRLSANKDKFLKYQQMMLPSKQDLAFEIRPKQIMQGLGALGEELSEWSMATRIVRSVAGYLADGPSTAERLEEHQRRCDVLLRRANRVRNAVIHGNNTVPAVVETVQPLLEHLTARVIRAEFQTLQTNDTIGDILDERRRLRADELSALRDGDGPSEILFARGSG